MTHLFVQRDFEPELVLEKPLMAHLATTELGNPRDSPVWFIWEDGFFWLFGTNRDSFVRRLIEEPRCALGVVDFDLQAGVLRHVGVRGTCQISAVDPERLHRFVAKYLGAKRREWNPWFVENIVNPLDVMIQITPRSIVAKDVSFFKTGPDLAKGIAE